MNVLWFSLSPCGSLRRNNTKRVIQGWLVSLEDAIKQGEDIHLSVSYLSSQKEAPFEYDGVTYYPISGRKYSKLDLLFGKNINFKKRDSEIVESMKDVIDKAKPDLIHIHGTEECFCLIAQEVKNIPILVSLQGLYAPIYERNYVGIPYVEFRRKDSIASRFFHFSAKDKEKAMKHMRNRELSYYGSIKYFVGRTEWDKEIVTLMQPDAKYFVIDEILRNDFYLERWSKRKFGKPYCISSILSPGQIIKGFETILKTANILKVYGNIDFSWNIIGYSGEESIVKISEDYTGLNSQDNNIIFCGLLDARHVMQHLKESDVYVQMSHIENSPNSVCEAMAIGMPVIATCVGGTSTMLKDEVEGLLIHDGDPYYAAAKIKSLLNNYDVAKKMADCAHERAMKRHNPVAISESMISVYRSVINDNTSRI